MYFLKRASLFFFLLSLARSVNLFDKLANRAQLFIFVLVLFHPLFSMVPLQGGAFAIWPKYIIVFRLVSIVLVLFHRLFGMVPNANLVRFRERRSTNSLLEIPPSTFASSAWSVVLLQ